MAGQGAAAGSTNDVYTFVGQQFAGMMETLRLQQQKEIVDAVRREVQKSNNEIRVKHEEEIDTLRHDHQASKNEVAALKEKLNTVKSETDAQIINLQEEISSRDGRINELLETVKSRDQRIAELEEAAGDQDQGANTERLREELDIILKDYQATDIPVPASSLLKDSVDAAHKAPERHTPASLNQDEGRPARHEPPVPTPKSSLQSMTAASASSPSQQAPKPGQTNKNAGKKPETPPKRILVATSLPRNGDFILQTYSEQAIPYDRLPQLVHQHIQREFEHYTYSTKQPYGGVDWWEILQEYRPRGGAKRVCLRYFICGGPQPMWSQECPTYYACLTCTNMQRPCLMWNPASHKINVLPLLPGTRSASSPRESGFWIQKDGDFTRSHPELRGLWEGATESTAEKRKADEDADSTSGKVARRA